MTAISVQRLGFQGLALALALATCAPARAATLNWKGFDWNVTNGGMAGVADGAAANVSVDADGYLHLTIRKNGNTWTASELFTTQKLGFGTYQWQIEGPIDTFDKNNVLGLFPYGPAAGIGADGTNEIDIEFSRWGNANSPNADFTDYPASGNVIGETTFTFSLGGSTSSTARFVWNTSSIESSVLKGHQAIDSEAGLLKKWKYAPNNSNVNIPQQALPLGINLWCFGAPPSDGQNVEIVIRDFQYVKEGDPLPGGGGAGGSSAGGTGGMGGGSGSANAGTDAGGIPNGGGNGGTPQGGGSGGSANAGTDAGGIPNGAGGVSGSGNGNGAQPSAAGSASPPGGNGTGGAVNGVAGAAVTPGAGATAGAASSGDNAAAPDTSSGCACRAGRASRSQSHGAAWLGLGLLALGRRRRRADH